MKNKANFKKSTEPYHIVYYVEDGFPGMRKFTSLTDMKTFFKEFKERYPKQSHEAGTFLDFSITNISGEVKFL